MRINHNPGALNTYSRLTQANINQSKSLEKLSSGLKINKAGDNAKGLAISEKMRAQIKKLEQSSRNAQEAITVTQVADGALNETHAALQRMRELAVQAGNDTNTGVDREAIQQELDQLAGEVNQIAENTNFNTKKLLDGTFSQTAQIKSDSKESLSLAIDDMRAHALGLTGDETVIKADADVSSEYALDVSNPAGAARSVAKIDEAIKAVSEQRSKIGAYTNRLEHTIANLDTASENLTNAESRIRNVDMAKDIMEYTKTNILNQAATAMLAQANQQPQGVLQLLR